METPFANRAQKRTKNNGSFGSDASHDTSEENLEDYRSMIMSDGNSLTDSDIEYKRMGDIETGDEVVSSGGTSTTVQDAYQEHIPESMYRLRFANGEILEASGNHLWYTVSSLDKQMHKERIKRAQRSVIPNLYASKLNWLQKTAGVSLEDSPSVDISFLFELLNVDTEDRELVWSITRVLESIGPVAVRNEHIFDERIDEIVESDGKSSRLYSLSLFCQQILALCAEALKSKNSTQYELLKGRVRNTEEIAETWELKHDFPSVRVS